jgi:hypothetical protein
MSDSNDALHPRSGIGKKGDAMTGLDWFLSIVLLTLYVTCLFTVCSLTFAKGYTVLGILGIFFPILWLIGAVLPAKEGSRVAVQSGMRARAEMDMMTR